ncbi:unnamed protein product [Closterium sp. Yama58-4]|nr:unnamed protein product [Closterium sp. Yama58-4]
MLIALRLKGQEEEGMLPGEERYQCSKESEWVGFVADLSMLQHQLRGTVEILDDCSFKVTRFDMLPGKDVYWWGAASASLNDLLHGFPVSPKPLLGTFNSQTVVVPSSPQPSKPLTPGLDTLSPGHALPSEPSYALPPQSPPLPSPPPPAKLRVKQGQRQPTMFDNCMQLSHRYRVRWTLDEARGFVDVGLEAVVGSGPHYLGFGWADPDSVTKFMGFSDVVIAGFDEVAKPFVEDYYITSYGECNLEKKPPEGVCPDQLMGGGNSSLNNVDLIYGHRVDGITFVRFRRPLVSPDKRFDHDIDAEDEMNVIWALASTKSFYVNGHEAPEIKVERGVPVQFSIQAGHDLGVYITSDPVGGRFNKSEIIYAGGEEAHGVPADPYTLLWKPTSSTPDLVYYQCYSEPKMGWRIHVVDGGLSDMYNHSFQLADGLVTMFWTLTASSISVAVRGEHPSGYIAIAFGSGMVNSWAYVGWVEGGEGRVASYWIDGKDASSVHATKEALDMTKCMQVDGVLTFEFSRPLKPPDSDCDDKCSVIDPSEPLKVIWAYGPSWTSGKLSYMNMHTVWSTTVTILDLETGEGTVEHLQPVFVVHGFMMTMAWAVLMPFGVLAARYLKHNDWLSIHQYTQYSALALMLLGLLFAVGELGGIELTSNHAKIGMATFALGCFQPINAFFRPPKPSPGERPQMKRVIWQWVHILFGRGALLVGGVALLTGIMELGETGGDDYTVDGFLWAMVGWFATIAAFVWFVERTRRQDHATPQELANMIRHDWNGSSPASSDMHVTQLDSEDSEDDTRTLIPSTHRSSSSSSSTAAAPAHTYNSPHTARHGPSASPARGNSSGSPARLGPTGSSPARLGPTGSSPARMGNSGADVEEWSKAARLVRQEQLEGQALDALQKTIDSFERPTFPCALIAGDVVILHLLHRLGALGDNPKVKVVFIDTFHLFPETYQFLKDCEERFGFKAEVFQAAGLNSKEDYVKKHGSDLFIRDIDEYDQICKVEPFSRALTTLNVDAMINGRRRDHGAERAHLELFEDGTPVKVQPLAYWEFRDCFDYLERHKVPAHPLHADGFPSIGDIQTTLPVPRAKWFEYGGERSGRFQGLKNRDGSDKTECGIHVEEAVASSLTPPSSSLTPPSSSLTPPSSSLTPPSSSLTPP